MIGSRYCVTKLSDIERHVTSDRAYLLAEPARAPEGDLADEGEIGRGRRGDPRAGRDQRCHAGQDVAQPRQERQRTEASEHQA